MNFAHITDTHFRHAPMESDGLFPLDKIVDWDGARLRLLLRRATGQSQRPDFVAITGDLVHESDAEDYRLFRALLEEELPDVPYYVALGNHDARAAFGEGFLGESGNDMPYWAAFEQGGLRIVALDSCLSDGHIGGRIGDAQLSWLEAELSKGSARGTVILMHHPIELVCDIALGDSGARNGAGGHALTLGEDSAALCDIVRKSKSVRAVLSGHTHFSSAYCDGGTMYATASSSAFGLCAMRPGRISFHNASSYNVCRLDGERFYAGQVNMPSYSGESMLEVALPA